jgi:NAD(P)H-flavin reductase
MLTTNIILKSKELSPSGQVAFLQFSAKETMDFQEGQFVMFQTDRIKDHKGNDMKRAYSIGTTNKQMQEQ